MELYLVNSVYHLLTALGLRALAPPGEAADLLLSDATPGLRGLLPRLEETGLFRQVLFARGSALAQRFPMNQEGPAARALEEGEALLRWSVEGQLAKEYHRVYFPNFDWLARLLACRYACPFFWVEDGFSSYVIDFARPDRAAVNRLPQGQLLRQRTQAALLYEPALAMRGDSLPNRALPRLSPEDVAHRELLNFVFDYQPPRHMPPFLFLEQSFRAEGISGNEGELMALCQDALGPGRFGVKTHPRNGAAAAPARRVDLPAPWELYLLNLGRQAPTVVTVCSNGALSGRLCLGLETPVVLLYPLYTGKVLWKEDEPLGRFLRAFVKLRGGESCHVPRTVFELENLLRYLGGDYGKC